MLIDSHTHLQHRRYREEEPQLSAAQLIEQANAAGVAQLINIACWRNDWQPALALSAEYPQVKTVVGIHPQDVASAELVTEAELLDLAQNRNVVAFGETGLDYYYDTSPKEQQQTSFHKHLAAAKKAGLPVVIHTRDAEEDTAAILREHSSTPFVLHCFTGTPWLAGQGIDLGGYVSFSGILTFKKSQDLRDIAASLPRDKVLIETDAPYLAPEPFRSKRNASFLLPHTAQVLANVWQTSVEDVAQITTANARRLFSRLSLV
jgi:TatD DNase family protein